MQGYTYSDIPIHWWFKQYNFPCSATSVHRIYKPNVLVVIIGR